MSTLLLPEALAAAGVCVKVLPDWDRAHKDGTYLWREPDDNPAGHMVHHTATSAYTPNRDKASGYLGMGDPTLDNPRLYQDAQTGRVPIYTLANAHPAPISSGSGRRDVLENFVKNDVPFTGKQTQPDDSPAWYGNTHYWNTECVLNGTGAAMPQEMWQTLVTVADVLNDVMDWTPARHIGHGQHTKRKVDLWNGTYKDMAATIEALRADIGQQEDNVQTLFKIGNEYQTYEEITWLLYEAAGGTINVNANSAQVELLLGKTNVRLVTDNDFTLLSEILGMNTKETDRLFTDGLYALGKELAALRSLVYG